MNHTNPRPTTRHDATRSSRRRFVVAGGLIAVAAACGIVGSSLGEALGQKSPPGIATTKPHSRPTGPQVITMTVHPSATTRPALKYRLLTPLAEQTPGDAGPLYLRVVSHSDLEKPNERVNTPYGPGVLPRFGLGLVDGEDEHGDWVGVFLDAPLDKLDSPEIRQFLGSFTTSWLPLLEIAATRESCDWALPIREQGFATLLPHLNGMRSVANAISVKARLDMARGDLPAALRTLRLGFAMARALDEQAVLIQHMVGVGITALTLQTLREAAEQPTCPNLYWALADLPKPLLNVRRALEMERAVIYRNMPELRKARDGTFTDDDWRALVPRIAQVTQVTGDRKASKWGAEGLGGFAAALVVMPQAKAYLVNTGLTQAQVDAMSPGAVLGRYFAGTYEEAYDEILKWSNAPYPVASAGRAKSEARLAELRAMGSYNFLMTAIPAVDRATLQTLRTERQLAAMQTVEALKAYAAGHGGQLPPSLDNLEDTPAPADPTTGEPFIYKVDGRTATLTSPTPPRMQPTDGLIVRVTLNP